MNCRYHFLGVFLCLFLSVGFLSGCATTQREPDANYVAYLQEIQAWRTMERKPLLKLEIDPNSLLIRQLEVHLPPERVEIRPFEPKLHPGWSLAGTTVKAAASVIGIGLVAEALVDIAHVAGHNNYYQDSYNQVGRDYNSLRDIQVYDNGNFNPTWDYSSVIQDSYNTDIQDSFHFGSHNTYGIDGDGNTITQGDQTWNLGNPWSILE